MLPCEDNWGTLNTGEDGYRAALDSNTVRCDLSMIGKERKADSSMTRSYKAAYMYSDGPSS